MHWFSMLKPSRHQARSASEADARLDTMTRAMWAEGCTSFVLTSLASPWEPLLEYLRATDAFRRRSMRLGLHVTHTSLLGVMVEGTFMNKLYHGCHNQGDCDAPGCMSALTLLDRLRARGGRGLAVTAQGHFGYG